jgi:tRNA-splicing ligase RtcB (3'-phosphate/5'-hydroxy nucleic acid ligase)
MEGRYRYLQKNVHDVPVGSLTVRVWWAGGAENRDVVRRAFQPLARTGFVHPYVALMPDWHPGQDAVVGSVVPSKDVLLPTVIGGDIGCGVCALRLPLSLADIAPALETIGARLRDEIPVGSAHNALVSERVKNHPLWEKQTRAPISNRTLRKLVRQFGSLGGGNHFLELQTDSVNRVWVMLHSGSRYLGVELRDWYVSQGAHQAGIDPRLYARIPYLIAAAPLANDYLEDMRLVMEFARESRREMMLRTLEVIREQTGALDPAGTLGGMIDVSHNYVAQEQHLGETLYVHRKGAIRLAAGQPGLVPGSMGTASFVVEGRGNEHGFSSSAHGGGRTMSRAEAKRKVSPKMYQQALSGVVCAHNALLLDEAPAAYKDIRQVMRGQADLVKTLFELHPILSVKGA